MEVVDFDVVDFVEEGNLDMVDKMVDIDSIESIFHKDFVLLVPKLEIDFEIGVLHSNLSPSLPFPIPHIGGPIL